MDGEDAGPAIVRELAARGGHAVSGRVDVRGRTPLAELLGRRGRLRAGEAVTLCAPLAETIALAHGLGIAHGGVRLEAIALDVVGRPLLTGWPHRLAPVERGAGGAAAWARAPAADPDRAADLRGLAALVRAVAGEPPTASTPLGSLLARLEGRGPLGEGDTAEAIADALYAWSEPEPISLEPASAPFAVGGAEPPSAPDGRADATPAATAPLRGARASLVAAARRRPRLGVAAAAAAALAVWLVAAQAVSPPHVAEAGHDAPAQQVGGGAPADPHGAAPAPAAESPASNGPPGPGVTVPAGEASPGSDPATPPATAPLGAVDDPVEAAAAIASRRAECMANHDPACLEALYVAGAPGFEADVARMEHPAGVAAIDPSRCTLADRAGEVALVHCPAIDGRTVVGFTIVRDAGRWRLREVHAP